MLGLYIIANLPSRKCGATIESCSKRKLLVPLEAH